MASDKKYGPSIPLARLYERVSKNGNHYLTGRLGAAKISILKSSDITDDDNDAPPPGRELTYTAVDPENSSDAPAEAPPRRSAGFDARSSDDEIPF